MSTQLIQNIFSINNQINLTVEIERNFWNKIVLNGYISPSKIRPKYGLNSLKLNDYNTIYNPIINRCTF